MSDRFDPASARLNKGLTQRAAAEAAGVSLQTLQRIEAGLGAHPANALKVAEFYEVSVVDLPAYRSGASA